MSNKTKNKICIWLAYLLSFIGFIMYGMINWKNTVIELSNEGNRGPFVLLTPYFEAQFFHFIFVCILAIYVKFSKKIPQEYKINFYLFPIITLFIIPIIGVFVGSIYSLLGFFGL